MEGNSSESFGSTVASHYNNIEDTGGLERQKSRIVYLRNFNNWIKGMLIDHYLNKVADKKKFREPLKVLDLACGKGGDLLKWSQNKVTHVVGVDIADGSIEDCKKRYEILLNKKNSRDRDRVFKGHFFVADCTKTRLRPRYEDPTIKFSIVSCQFAFHYCFESLPQAEQMLQNIAECLEPGGYFIGTLPDANTIVCRHREAGRKRFGNEVYHIEVEDDGSETPPKLFGAKYDFQLKGVVNCPEFLVHFPTFIRLADKYDLTLVEKKTFPEYFLEMKDTNRGSMLLRKMSALENYPPYPEVELVGKDPEDYEHAARLYKTISSKDSEKSSTKDPEGNDKNSTKDSDEPDAKRLKTESSEDNENSSAKDSERGEDHERGRKRFRNFRDNENDSKKIGTLTASEWEVAGLYLIFAFQKRRPS